MLIYNISKDLCPKRITVKKRKDFFNENRANLAYKFRSKSPCYHWESVLDNLCGCRKKTKLRNKKGQFSVLVTDKLSAYRLLKRCICKGLTVNGDGSAKGVDKVDLRLGDFIVFGAEDKKFDVDYVRKTSYIRNNHLVPIYDIYEDWETVLDAVDDLVKEYNKLYDKAGQPEQILFKHLKGTNKPVVKKDKKKYYTVAVGSSWSYCGGYLYPKRAKDKVVFTLR